MGTWISRREVTHGAWGIRNGKLREHQYREGYVMSLEGKRLEWDRENNVDLMWEKLKQVMVKRAREVYGSVRMGKRTQRVCGGTMR